MWLALGAEALRALIEYLLCPALSHGDWEMGDRGSVGDVPWPEGAAFQWGRPRQACE